QVAINATLRKYNNIRPHHALHVRQLITESSIEKPQITGTENVELDISAFHREFAFKCWER
ncbi:MAG: hypothetical protein MK107_11460, partial [Oceanicola sp.]|nr:hypothetical protein [Oceanicola sp.]